MNLTNLIDFCDSISIIHNGNILVRDYKIGECKSIDRKTITFCITIV